MNETDLNKEYQQETYISMIEIGIMMIKFSGAINGGALLALLTFIGNAFKNGQQLDMTFPFILYAIGLTSTGFATMTTYIIQKTLYESKNSVWGYRFTWIFIVLSVGCFLVASICAAITIAA